MRPPTLTGGAYEGASLILPRMYGSSDRYWVLMSTCPSPGSGTGADAIVKFPAVGLPAGRDASRICVFWSAMAAAYTAAPQISGHHSYIHLHCIHGHHLPVFRPVRAPGAPPAERVRRHPPRDVAVEREQPACR